jgi:hypothetical protein
MPAKTKPAPAFQPMLQPREWIISSRENGAIIRPEVRYTLRDAAEICARLNQTERDTPHWLTLVG